MNSITKAYVSAFFEAHLRASSQARDYLNAANPAELVTLKHRP